MPEKPSYEELEQKIEELSEASSKNESSLREVQKLAKIGSWEWNLEQQTLIWSDEVYRIFGLDPKTFKPSVEAFEAAIHPDDRDIFFEQRELMLNEKKEACIDHRIVLPDGSVRYVQERTQLILNDQDEISRVIGTVQDITERKLAENALRENEDRYRSFVKNFQGIAFHGKMDFTPIFFHGAVEEITGYTEREFLDGKPRWNQVIHREDLPAILTEEEEKLHSIPQHSYEREYRIVRKDGAVRWVHEVIQNVCDNSGKPAILQGALYDITERKRTQIALQEAYNIINKSPAVAFLWKHLEGWPVEFVSENVMELFGYAAEEFTSGQVSYAMTVHPDDLERVTKEVATFSNEKERKMFAHEPYRIVTKEGKTKWIDDRTFIRRDNNGKITHFQGIVIDITLRKQAEKSLQEVHDELEKKVIERTHDLENSKKAAEAAYQTKSEFLANMGHEFYTPLNHILGYTEMIVDQHFGQLNDTQKEYLDHVLSSSRHLLSMIIDILDISKLEAHEMKINYAPTDLKALLENSIDMIKGKASKKGIQILPDIRDLPKYITADEDKLNRILFNLLSNAVKFTSKKGAIRLKAYTISNGECKQASGVVNGQMVEIAVQDSGIGLQFSDIDRIFNPLEQADNSRNKKFQGIGSGLSLAKTLAELIKGTIRAESKGPGQGSTFYLTIPVKPYYSDHLGP